MTISVALIGWDKDLWDLLTGDPSFTVAGVFDRNSSATQKVPWLGPDEAWPLVHSTQPGLRVMYGMDAPALKERLFPHYGAEAFVSVVAASAYVASGVSLAPGSVVQRGVTVLADVSLGRAPKLNVNATIHHDCSVGDFCTLAPGAHLLGSVVLEERVFVGARATILPGVRVGRGATVGAGAVVNRDVPEGWTVAGVPARRIDRAT